MEQLVCLGGFRNVRSDYDWEGAKLELDETHFAWGTVFEIEVESVRPCISLAVLSKGSTCCTNLCDERYIKLRLLVKHMVIFALEGQLARGKPPMPGGAFMERQVVIHVLQAEPEELKVKLEAFLKERSVAYKYSSTTKFANFINKTLE